MRTLKASLPVSSVIFNGRFTHAVVKTENDYIRVPSNKDGLVKLEDTPENRDILESLGISYALS